MMGDRRHAGGFALILVIGLVAAAAVLGLAFIEASGLTVHSSANMVRLSRARYLAESGVEQALYWLTVPNPPNHNLDGYWPGASRQAVDDTSDYYDVTVLRDAADPTRYQITSVGYCMSSPTAVALSHRVAVSVRVSADATVQADKALLFDQGCTLVSNQTYVGNVHSNAWVVSGAAIQGDLTASGYLLFTLRPLGLALGFRPAVSFPPFQPSTYWSYTLSGTTYQAVVYSDRHIDGSFKDEGPAGTKNNPTWNITPTNPGGVLKCTSTSGGRGKVVVRSNAAVTGTITINGDVYIRGQSIVLTAQPGFPAIVCSGDIVLEDRNASVTVNGGIIAGGSIRPANDIRGGRMTVNGFIRLGGGMSLAASNGFDITVNAANNPARTWLYDFTASASANEVTVERWNDH